MNYKPIQIMKQSEKAEIIFAAVEALDEPVVVKRLFEANEEIYRVIAGLQNPHIPKIYTVEEENGELLIVEEYIDGRPLDIYLKKEELSDTQKLALMLQLCDALIALHECEPPIIHRDIKPSNILISDDGVLKIIDFDASRQYKNEKNTGDTRLLGTIEYAAPEQFGYAQTDFRSDIYSAGVVFSELEIDEKRAFFREWKRLVDKCTSFDPKNRYKDVAELKKDLQKCIRMAEQPIGTKWLVPVAAGVILVVMLAVGGLQMQRERSREVTLLSPTPIVLLTTEPEASKVPEEINVTQATEESEKNEINVTQATEESERNDITEVPQTTLAPEGDGIILEEDRLVWENKEVPAFARVNENAGCGIAEVYICEQGDEKDPFSETIKPLAMEFYEVSDEGKQLQIGADFLKQYGAEVLVLYIVFDDGRGERLWIMCEEVG